MSAQAQPEMQSDEAAIFSPACIDLMWEADSEASSEEEEDDDADSDYCCSECSEDGEQQQYHDCIDLCEDDDEPEITAVVPPSAVPATSSQPLAGDRMQRSELTEEEASQMAAQYQQTNEDITCTTSTDRMRTEAPFTKDQHRWPHADPGGMHVEDLRSRLPAMFQRFRAQGASDEQVVLAIQDELRRIGRQDSEEAGEQLARLIDLEKVMAIRYAPGKLMRVIHHASMEGLLQEN